LYAPLAVAALLLGQLFNAALKLKRIVADQELDNAALKDLLNRKW